MLNCLNKHSFIYLFICSFICFNKSMNIHLKEH
nr:MAG TPA: hypothetical protein [Caudoviricetes sp.]